MNSKWIEKVGLAVLDGERLLVVRKRGGRLFILPGGKPEGAETATQTLVRELDEELGCKVDAPHLLGTFMDKAAGNDDAVVVVRLYGGSLVGEPVPQAEIEEAAWVNIRRPTSLPLAPSILNFILPYLRKQANRTSRLPADANVQPAQGLLHLL